jgi:hypothetical protein
MKWAELGFLLLFNTMAGVALVTIVMLALRFLHWAAS